MYLKYFVILIILVLAVLFGIFIGSKLYSGTVSKEAEINIKSTVKEILPAAEYTSLVYHYTSVITHSEAAKLFSFDIPLTEKKAIYTIDGSIKMGFNCADIAIDISYNSIVLKMPRIKILSHEIYPETFSLYDEKTSLFNRYTLKDANAIQLANKDEMELKVKQNRGLYLQAMKFAEDQFKQTLENLPGIKGIHTVIFDWQGAK
ncbi:MAG: DUF4230 domain-containing protein [Endomicrobia bacterium]|nr:DUF4230 domain-containing protein [Endomicrobiia bacterium]